MVGEAMRRDVHPAEVVLPDGSVLTGDLRVFVTSHRLLAYRYDQQVGRAQLAAELILEQPNSVVADMGTLGSGTVQAETPDGIAVVNRGAGCGCGSPLKAMGQPAPW